MTESDNPFASPLLIENCTVVSSDAGVTKAIHVLQSTVRWSVLATSFVLIATFEWCLYHAIFVFEYVFVANEWHGDRVIGGGIGVAIFLALLWPAYWVRDSVTRTRCAQREPTFSVIADVLEAQRYFWRALGILVLLAIAAIVVSATYPHWSELFA